jgi:hypothetical protein
MYTYDGIYEGFFPTVNYKFTISAPGYTPQTWNVPISPGLTAKGQNVYLEQSNLPVPHTVATTVVSMMGASLMMVRRKRG